MLPGEARIQRREICVSIGIVSLLVIVVVIIIGIPILARIFGEAASRNENTPGGEGDEQAGRDDERGPGGQS